MEIISEMKLDEKRKLTEEIKKGLLKSKASFILDYRGLKVVELTDFRNKLRENKASFRVVKNTLANRALKEAKLEMLSDFFSGPTGIIFAQDEPLKSAKVVKEFISEHSNLKIKGGLLENYLLDANRVLSLADLPQKSILLSQLVAVLQSPLRRFIRVLNYPLINFIIVIKAIIEQKGGLSMPAEAKEVSNAGKKEGQKMEKKKEIIKVIEQMNVLELSELVKDLENKFGVQAAAYPQGAVTSAPATQEKPKEEEKTEFDVILSEIGPKKIQVIKEVRKLTSLGLKEAKDLVEQSPKPVKEGITKEEALKIKQTLEAVGAKVELK